MSLSTIGFVSLNASFFLYLFYYLPQLWHNSKKANIENLSVSFHFLLLAAYFCDLIYGVSQGLPWQYRLVSLCGLVCLFVQQKQLYHHYRWQICSPVSFFIITIGFISLLVLPLNEFLYLSTGYLASFLGIICFLPQLFKNSTRHNAKSLSIVYLLMRLFAIGLDNVSAWALHWPTPSKIGAFLNLIVTMIAFYQWLQMQKYLRLLPI